MHLLPFPLTIHSVKRVVISFVGLSAPATAPSVAERSPFPILCIAKDYLGNSERLF